MATKFDLPSASPSESHTSTPARPCSPSDQDSDDDDYTLPYPAELQRSAFLAPDFNPQTYLSTLRNRHQTLEDLRSDLRQRSQLLNKELLDLVNGNYEEFLSLGAGLKGGEEKVEGVRVGVLGFGREVDGLRQVVDERKDECEGLLGQKKDIRRDVMFGRSLLELHEQVEELEEASNVQGQGVDGGADDEFDEDQNDDADTSTMDLLVRKLQRRSQQYALITRLLDRISTNHDRQRVSSHEHPLLVSLRPRITELQRLLSLDLSSALNQAKGAQDSKSAASILGLFSLLKGTQEP